MVALRFSILTFDLKHCDLQMPGHYEDKLKDVWRAFGTSLSCRVTKGCLWPLYGPAHTFKKLVACEDMFSKMVVMGKPFP